MKIMSDEERKSKIKEQDRRYYEKNKEKIKRNVKTWKNDHGKEKHLRYLEENSEVIKAQKRGYYAEHRGKFLERSRVQRKDNPEEVKQARKKWAKANKYVVNAHNSNRRAQRRNATPLWLSKEEKLLIQEVYFLAQERTKTTGVQWHVDHIVPLAGKTVCGLHVPWNLQVLIAVDNIRKFNRLEEKFCENM